MDEDLIKKIKVNRIKYPNGQKQKGNQDLLIQKLEKYGLLKNEYKDDYFSEGNSIVYNLKNSRMSSNESGFIGLEKNIKDIAKLNLDMNKKLLAGKSIPYKVYVNSVDFIKSKIFGKEPYSIEDIFDKQVNNISNMNSGLNSIIFTSKKELKDLIIYRDEVLEEWANSTKEYNELKKIEPGLNEVYLGSGERVKSTKKNDYNFFIFKKGNKNAERKSRAVVHQKNRAANKISGRSEEDKILNDLEDMLTTAIEVCEIVSDKTSGILRYVRNTKKQWNTLVSGGRIVETLYESVSMLGNYSNDLHERLNEGLKNMGSIANNPNTLNSYYLKTHPGLEKIANEVVRNHLNGVENFGNSMDSYLNNIN